MPTHSGQVQGSDLQPLDADQVRLLRGSAVDDTAAAQQLKHAITRMHLELMRALEMYAPGVLASEVHEVVWCSSHGVWHWPT